MADARCVSKRESRTCQLGRACHSSQLACLHHKKAKSKLKFLKGDLEIRFAHLPTCDETTYFSSTTPRRCLDRGHLLDNTIIHRAILSADRSDAFHVHLLRVLAPAAGRGHLRASRPEAFDGGAEEVCQWRDLRRDQYALLHIIDVVFSLADSWIRNLGPRPRRLHRAKRQQPVW